MWVFTKHVLARMEERGFTHDDILMILDGDVPVLVYPSQKDKTVDLYFGKSGNRFLMIPADRIEKTIITVRPMRKEEKAVFLKEMKNE
jgi:hypothetical protein